MGIKGKIEKLHKFLEDITEDKEFPAKEIVRDFEDISSEYLNLEKTYEELIKDNAINIKIISDLNLKIGELEGKLEYLEKERKING